MKSVLFGLRNIHFNESIVVVCCRWGAWLWSRRRCRLSRSSVEMVPGSSPIHVMRAFHPSGVNEWISDLSGMDKTMVCLSAGYHKSLYRSNKGHGIKIGVRPSLRGMRHAFYFDEISWGLYNDMQRLAENQVSALFIPWNSGTNPPTPMDERLGLPWRNRTYIVPWSEGVHTDMRRFFQLRFPNIRKGGICKGQIRRRDWLTNDYDLPMT